MLKPKESTGLKRLSEINIKEYIEGTYHSSAVQVADKQIADFTPLLQEHYGGDNDCTLTCITAIIYYITNKKYKTASIYNDVESVAKKHFYRGSNGTHPITIKSIFDNSLKKYGNKKSKSGHLKNVGYNLNMIVSQINKNNPLILSLSNDGLGCYKNHSVVVIGYRTYSVGDKIKTVLKIHDNWTKRVGYLDYEKISSVSTLNYVV